MLFFSNLVEYTSDEQIRELSTQVDCFSIFSQFLDLSYEPIVIKESLLSLKRIY